MLHTWTAASSGNLLATVTTYVSSNAIAVVGTTDRGFAVDSCSVHMVKPCFFCFCLDLPVAPAPPPPVLTPSFMRIRAALVGDLGAGVPSPPPLSELDGSGGNSKVS